MAKVVFCGGYRGSYRVVKGKQAVVFEDHEVFGPFALNTETGELDSINDHHRWFWGFYDLWRLRNRPVTGETIPTPVGELKLARWPT